MLEKTNTMNILVVDDEKEICKMFNKFLSIKGHRVKSVLTGKKAIKLVKRKYFDFVFLDIVMPGVPASEVLEEIRKISQTTRIVIITGKLVNKNLLSEFRKKGASECIQKPFRMEEIEKIVSLYTFGGQIRGNNT